MGKNKKEKKPIVVQMPVEPVERVHYKNTYIQKSSEGTTDTVTKFCGAMWKYVSFGANERAVFNYSYMRAIELIGQLYSSSSTCDASCSNYHNGIKYIKEQANTTKEEIKKLKITYKRTLKNQVIYSYKYSYQMLVILQEMIKAIKDHESETCVKEFFDKAGTASYLEAILGDSYPTFQEHFSSLQSTENTQYDTICKIRDRLSLLESTYSFAS